MTEFREWFCRRRRKLLRWSLTVGALSALAVWSIGRVLPIDASNIIVVIGATLFAVWRPHRDTWLRASCSQRTHACA